MCYTVQPRDQIFVKGYGFLDFPKYMGKNIGKNIRKNLSGKYSQKFLDEAKQSATDVFKTASKRSTQKTAEATGDLIGNEIANKITKVSKTSQQNNSETVTSENYKEIPKETYISLEKRQNIVDKIRLINLLDNTPNQQLNLRQKIEFK